MKITYVVQRTFPDLLNGSERYIHDLSSSVSSQYEVALLATRKYKSNNVNNLIGNQQIVTFSEFPINLLTSPIRYGISSLQNQELLNIYSSVFKGFLHSSSMGFFSLTMKHYLNTHKSDIFHVAAVPTATAWLTWRVSTKRGIPLVITPFLHYTLMDHNVTYIKEMLKESSAVIAVTEKERQRIITLGVSESNVHVIPLGIDYKKYDKVRQTAFREQHNIDEDSFVILIPRKSKGKGTFDTLKAIVSLSEKYKNLTLILLDEASKKDRSELEYYKKRLFINGVTVIDVGFVTGLDLVTAYQACDVVVEPSKVDSFGIIYLEAWACEKPVIAADVGAIPDIVHNNKNGLIVKFGDCKGIEDAMYQLINDAVFKRMLGENGKKDVKTKYALDNMVKKTKIIYNRFEDF